MNPRREFSRIKIEDIKDRETALRALSMLPEDTYRRTKGKALSILEGVGLDKNSEDLHKKMLIGYLKSIANGQADIVYTILDHLLDDGEKKNYIRQERPKRENNE